jgi:hypothetical protein
LGIGKYKDSHSRKAKIMNIKKVLGVGLAIATGFIAAPAFAGNNGGGGGAQCGVTQQNGNGTIFYIPTGGGVRNGATNIVGWGNGTGGGRTTYQGLLRSVAQQCVLVAAATTANSGDGRDVQSAVQQARQRFGNLVGNNPKVCTGGHSQGGGGAFNAANRLNNACVIGLQPDTVFTVRIQRPVAANVDVACIFSTGDVLAPALPSNAANCRRNSTRYTQRTTSGTHFTPVSGDGGAPGAAFRDFVRQFLL